MRNTCATGTHTEPGALLDTCMPYLNSLGQQYGQDAAYENTGSPSLPNYLSFWGGSTFGVTDDHPPSYHPIAGDSVGDEALAAGKTVKAYEESMPSNCKLSAYNHLYFPKHNPWAYFNGTTQRHNCKTFDVPMGTTSSGAFASDIANGKLPTIGYAVGNVCNDGHNDNSTANPPNCYPRTVSDPWFKAWMTKIFAGPQWQAGNLTVIVTTDEADADGAGHNIPFVVIDKRLAGKQISFPANHYSLWKWLAQAAGATLPHNAATASDLKAAFGL